jgi:hypothetical protein
VLKSESQCLLIADISGYTTYLAGVELDHAQDILADLIGTVVTALRPTFRLAKLEGDAAFVVAPTKRVDGSLLLDTIEACYLGFRRRRRDVRQATACGCNACVRIPDLNLKFVAHAGDVIRQRVAGQDELLGAPVIVVHRLLKNDVIERTGIPAYALISQEVSDTLGLDPAGLGMTEHVASYEGIGEVAAWVHDLERRWQEEEARARVLVPRGEELYNVTAETTAPPQVVWEFMTTPGRRVAWQAGVTEVIVTAKGNRRAVGSTNHCMHGKDAVVEEVLDWRPFDYYTVNSTMNTPGGPVHFLSTVELEPIVDGTRIEMRYAAPIDPAESQILAAMGPMFEGVFAETKRRLVEQLTDELETRTIAEGPDLAELPTPSRELVPTPTS